MPRVGVYRVLHTMPLSCTQRLAPALKRGKSKKSKKFNYVNTVHMELEKRAFKYIQTTLKFFPFQSRDLQNAVL